MILNLLKKGAAIIVKVGCNKVTEILAKETQLGEMKQEKGFVNMFISYTFYKYSSLFLESKLV